MQNVNKPLITKALKESNEKMYSTYVDTPGKKAVIFDLDGTLCESRQDRPYSYGEEVLRYDIYEELLKEWYPLGVEIIILTGRKRKEHGNETEKWLEDNEVPYDQLIMQEGGQAKKNHIYKEEALKELMKTYEIAMLYDDNPDVGEVCERLGIPFQLVEESNVLVDRGTL